MSNELDQAIADLRKVVIDENPNRDRFPVGTVIRWTASERYTYAVVKTGYAWFTTARPSNHFVKQQMTYEELQEVLQRDEVSDIAIATAWSTLDGRPASSEVPVEAPRPFKPNPSISEAFGYPEGDPSADAGNDRTFARANPGVAFEDDSEEPGYGMMPGLGGSGEHV